VDSSVHRPDAGDRIGVVHFRRRHKYLQRVVLFNLSFVDPLTNAGGTDTFRAPSFSSVGSFAQNAFNGSKDPIISGSVIGTALPEPGSGVLLIAGIAAIVAWDRSRQTAQFTAVRAVSSKEHPAR